ncbi:MAG: NfeD family protein [Candidatus Rokubacteria bacterium]|nr:NfeD family protein [Candidatus Rokubacteria bacterium]
MMRAPRETPRELGRYVVWQLPEWGLVALLLVWLARVLDFSGWTGAAIFGVWAAKDLLLFPVMRAVFRGPGDSVYPIGAWGTTVDALTPSGYIRVKGELWSAASLGGRPVPAGTPVIVRDGRGLTLFVEAAEADAGQSALRS